MFTSLCLGSVDDVQPVGFGFAAALRCIIGTFLYLTPCWNTYLLIRIPQLDAEHHVTAERDKDIGEERFSNKIKGRGVFAKTTYPKQVLEYRGEEITYDYGGLDLPWRSFKDKQTCEDDPSCQSETVTFQAPVKGVEQYFPDEMDVTDSKEDDGNEVLDGVLGVNEGSWEAYLNALEARNLCPACTEWGHFVVSCPALQEEEERVHQFPASQGDCILLPPPPPKADDVQLPLLSPGKDPLFQLPPQLLFASPPPEGSHRLISIPTEEDSPWCETGWPGDDGGNGRWDSSPPYKRDNWLDLSPTEGDCLLSPIPLSGEEEMVLLLPLPPPPAEGEYLLVPPQPPWEDCLPHPPPPAEGECLLVTPPPLGAEQQELPLPPPPPPQGAEQQELPLPLPPPPAEGEYLLVPPQPPWEDCLPHPPPPAEGECLLVTPPPLGAEQQELPLPPPPPPQGAEQQELPLPPPLPPRGAEQ
ncbi:UNVERIFIED_CONTAM: hypothetical protein FKN15_061467 [Acipenser sinensis]